MYCFILVRTSTYQYMQVQTSTDQYIPAHTGTYQYIPDLYWYVLVHTCKFLDSKKVQTRFGPVILCILFACSPTALREYR